MFGELYIHSCTTLPYCVYALVQHSTLRDAFGATISVSNNTKFQ